MHTPSLLITGITGILGTNLSIAARGRFKVVGISRNPSNDRGYDPITQDLTERSTTLERLRQIHPRWIIHTAADANVDRCEDHREEALRANAEVPETLAIYAQESGCRLIHISTDAFFDREGHRFTENERPTPMNYYGETKLKGEESVARTCPSALIARTNFFGWNPKTGVGMAEWMLSRLVRGEDLPAFTNVWFTPIEVRTLADTLFDLLEMPVTGVLHVAGADSLSKHDFCLKLAEAFGLSAKRVQATQFALGTLKARRAEAMSLDIRKLQSLFPQRDFSVYAGLRRFVNSIQDGHASAVKGRTWNLECYR